MKRGEVFSILDSLSRKVAKCHDCRLSLTRTKTVFAAGNPEAEVVVLGEGPGEEEDRQGEPFVGKSGVLQVRILETIGLSRKDVYICNVVKCRACREPSDEEKEKNPYWRKHVRNRTPEADEIKACRKHLHEQLEVLPRKKLIFAMGSVPGHFLLDYEQGKLTMRGMRGKVFSTGYGPVIVTYHPSYLLRNPQEKAKTFRDLLFVQSFLRGEIGEELWEHPSAAEEKGVRYEVKKDERGFGKLRPFQKDPYSEKLEVR